MDAVIFKNTHLHIFRHVFEIPRFAQNSTGNITRPLRITRIRARAPQLCVRLQPLTERKGRPATSLDIIPIAQTFLLSYGSFAF